LISGTQEYAGLGGNTKYLKHEIEGKYFYSFYKNKITAKIAGTGGDIVGVAGKAVRISDRFNIGDYTLRGFQHGGVGPRDKITKEGLGGQKFYTLSAELNFPIGLPEELGVTGAAFIDAGSAWKIKLPRQTSYRYDSFYNDKAIRVSGGFGLIWVTRLAPIRIDWALPVKKKRYDETQRFHVRFSTHF
jgi:outer membrane protein insertion porin family